MIGLLINVIHTVITLLIFAIIADVVVSYFMSPYHPVRSFLDRIIQPLLRPIQRIIPSMMGIDFSPLLLLLLVQLIETLLVNSLTQLR
jgi:YggT family protein